MGNIFCSPLGGLCNKIRHIVCGKILAESLGYNFYITDWIDNDYMPGFDTVFNINNTYNVRETDVDIDFYVNMDTTPIYDLNELKKYNNIFLPGFSIIKILDMPEEEWNIKFTEYLKLIDPVKSIKGKIPKLNENTIGIHIRRGDNEISIKNSPIEKFLETLTLHSDRNIFLTTDDKEVETLLVAKYPNIITNKKTGFHNNKTIIRADIRTEMDLKRPKGELITTLEEAIIDLYTLSQCKLIYGSYWSSFSEIAAEINKSKLIMVK